MAQSLKQKLKAGEVFEFNTHAELLNEIFGTDYRAWMKAWWRFSYDTIVQFVRIDGKVRNEFTNTWLNEDSYIQNYVGHSGIYDGRLINIGSEHDYRLVFDIVDGAQRKYIFKGFFRLNRKISTSKSLTFEKVSDVYPMN